MEKDSLQKDLKNHQQNISPLSKNFEETLTLKKPQNPHEKNFNLEKFLQTDNTPSVSKEELHKYSVAPMLDVTNRHFRFITRLLSLKTTLYTEMIHCDTILNTKNISKLLEFSQIEKPLILQLGGSNPEKLAKAAKFVEDYGENQGFGYFESDNIAKDEIEIVKANENYKNDDEKIINIDDEKEINKEKVEIINKTENNDNKSEILIKNLSKIPEIKTLLKKGYKYDGINLNCGCPSPKVTKNSFGACLMKNPYLVGECMLQIKNTIKTDISVKCRIGVDNQDDFEFLEKFVKIIYRISKIDNFIIHARKAHLKGLNPKQNRNIPPLIYERVFKIAEIFPDFKISLNGGLKKIKDMKNFLEQKKVFGIMVGRACYENLMHMAEIDFEIFGSENRKFSREFIIRVFGKYCDFYYREFEELNFNIIIKPVLSVFAFMPGNRIFRKLCMDKKKWKEVGSYEKFLEEIIEKMRGINKKALEHWK